MPWRPQRSNLPAESAPVGQLVGSERGDPGDPGDPVGQRQTAAAVPDIGIAADGLRGSRRVRRPAQRAGIRGRRDGFRCRGQRQRKGWRRRAKAVRRGGVGRPRIRTRRVPSDRLSRGKPHRERNPPPLCQRPGGPRLGSPWRRARGPWAGDGRHGAAAGSGPRPRRGPPADPPLAPGTPIRAQFRLGYPVAPGGRLGGPPGTAPEAGVAALGGHSPTGDPGLSAAAFTAEQTARYLQHHLESVGIDRPMCTGSALQAGHDWSQGIARRLNTGAQTCLRAAYAAQSPRVDDSVVATASHAWQWAGTGSS